MEWRVRRGVSLGVRAAGRSFGVDLTPLLTGGGSSPAQGGGPLTGADKAAGEFVAVTSGDTEDIRASVFKSQLAACDTFSVRTPQGAGVDAPRDCG